MLNSTYAPTTWGGVESHMVIPNLFGSKQTATAGQTTTFDLKINDDSLIEEIELTAKSSIYGDLLTLEVIDKDGLYAAANTVLQTPVTDFVIKQANDVLKYVPKTPLKTRGGLYLRFSYESTGLVNVDVAVNLVLLTILL